MARNKWMTSFKANVTTSGVVIMQLKAAANIALWLQRIRIQALGVNSAAVPALIDLLRYTGSPTGGTTVALRKTDPGRDETLQGVAYHASQPTGLTIDTANSFELGDISLWQSWVSEPLDIIIPGGAFLGIRGTIPSGGSACDMRVTLEGEE